MVSLLLLILLNISFAKQSSLHSNCIGLHDGYHWLKLMDDTDNKEYPAVYVLCDNEYMIIDVNHDPNLMDYFDSWDTYHYALAGSKDKLDGKNWEEWWLPNAQYTSSSSSNSEEEATDESYFKYAISPTCDVCDTDINHDSIQKYADQTYADEYGSRTAYYMTGTIFGCMSYHKALRDCLWDWDTYECGFCTASETNGDEEYIYIPSSDTESIQTYQNAYSDEANWKTLQVSLCGVYPQASYTDAVPSTNDECFDFHGIKPSIGTDGRYCMCVQPTKQQTFEISTDSLNAYELEKDEREREKNVETYTTNDVYELYQTDFEDGTYRITHSGTYKIMENIEFDFNSPDNYDHPNDGDAWWPKASQADDYPGAYSTRDEYFLGFFAGITVEADDVVIDLNEFTIAQSKAFYYQQRHFACISLKSVIFNLNQGPGIFGTDPKFASNVIIKNGNIGLSSHFGIHGIWNENVLISNVHVFDFETHGIEMSYFTDLVITDVEIGPSSTIAYLKADYAYSRFTLQRMFMISENLNGKTDYSLYFPMTFGNRDESVSFSDITQRLNTQMDMAFRYVMGEEEYDDNDQDWIAAKTLYINQDGLPYGAVMYGLFLNLYFANVFVIHPSLKHSENVFINNLEIHDLRHNSMEYVRLDLHGVGPYHNPYAAGFDASALLGYSQISVGNDNIDWNAVSYVGDALTDAHIALKTATTDAGIWGVALMPDVFINWAIGTNEYNNGDSDNDNVSPSLGCNGDRMSHLLKGVIGIRIDGVDNVQINGLEIANLFEYSDLGSSVCGAYYDVWDSSARTFGGGGHFLENSPYSYGFTGNRIHGIFADWTTLTLNGDIDIHDLYSDTGLVRGIGMYLSANLVISNDNDNDANTMIKLHDMGAGVELTDIDTTQLSHPFVAAYVQPITVFSEIDNYKYEENESDEVSQEDDIDYENEEFYGSINAPTLNLQDWVFVSCVYADDSIVMTDIEDVTYDNDRNCQSDLISNLLANQEKEESKKVSFSKSYSKSRNVWDYVFVFVIIVIVAIASLCVCNSKNQYGKVNENNKYSNINSQFVINYGTA